MGKQTGFSISALREKGCEVTVELGEVEFDWDLARRDNLNQDELEEAAYDPHYHTRRWLATLHLPKGDMTAYPLDSEDDDEAIFDTKHTDPESVRARLQDGFNALGINWKSVQLWEG